MITQWPGSNEHAIKGLDEAWPVGGVEKSSSGCVRPRAIRAA